MSAETQAQQHFRYALHVVFESEADLESLFMAVHKKIHGLKKSDPTTIYHHNATHPNMLQYLAENRLVTLSRLQKQPDFFQKVTNLVATESKKASEEFLQKKTNEVLVDLHSEGDSLYTDLDETASVMENKVRPKEQTDFFDKSSLLFVECYKIIKAKLPDLEANLSKKTKKNSVIELYSRLGSLTWVADYGQDNKKIIFQDEELNKLKNAIETIAQLKKMLDKEFHEILVGDD